MQLDEDTNTWNQVPGEYIESVESFSQEGRFNTELDIGDTFNVAVGTKTSDGASVG